MASLLIGGVVIIIVSCFVFIPKQNGLAYATSCAIGILLLFGILAGMHKGSWSVPNYEYQSVVYQNNEDITVYFDEFECESGRVTIKDFDYLKPNAWTLDGYQMAISPITIEVTDCCKFSYESNKHYHKDETKSQKIIEGVIK
jgi:hypothetical protein